MPEISITITGIDDVVKRLGSGWAEKAMRLPMEHSLMSLVDYLEEYPGPPQRPYPNMLRTACWKFPSRRRMAAVASYTSRCSCLLDGRLVSSRSPGVCPPSDHRITTISNG